MSYLSLHIYGCNDLFIFMFVHFSPENHLRRRCLLWVCQLADVRCDWLRPHKAPRPGSVPSPLQPAARSFDPCRSGQQKWVWVLAGVIFHSVYASLPISKGHVRESCQVKKKKKGGGAVFTFCEDRKPSLRIHSCEVDGDCTTGEHYSIYWAHPHPSPLRLQPLHLAIYIYSVEALTHMLSTWAGIEPVIAQSLAQANEILSIWHRIAHIKSLTNGRPLIFHWNNLSNVFPIIFYCNVRHNWS